MPPDKIENRDEWNRIYEKRVREICGDRLPTMEQDYAAMMEADIITGRTTLSGVGQLNIQS